MGAGEKRRLSDYMPTAAACVRRWNMMCVAARRPCTDLARYSPCLPDPFTLQPCTDTLILVQPSTQSQTPLATTRTQCLPHVPRLHPQPPRIRLVVGLITVASSAPYRDAAHFQRESTALIPAVLWMRAHVLLGEHDHI